LEITRQLWVVAAGGLEMGDNKSAFKIQQSLDDHKANSKKAR
jgi:hypothetical protein